MVLLKEELKKHLWGVISQCREQTNAPSSLISSVLAEIMLEVKSDEMQEMFMEVMSRDATNQKNSTDNGDTQCGGNGGATES